MILSMPHSSLSGCLNSPPLPVSIRGIAVLKSHVPISFIDRVKHFFNSCGFLGVQEERCHNVTGTKVHGQENLAAALASNHRVHFGNAGVNFSYTISLNRFMALVQQKLHILNVKYH